MLVSRRKPFSAWGEIFGDDTTATAMVDRPRLVTPTGRRNPQRCPEVCPETRKFDPI